MPRISMHVPETLISHRTARIGPITAFDLLRSRMAAEIGLGAVPSFVPDVVHAHDWQAGLTHAYLHYSGRRRPAR